MARNPRPFDDTLMLEAALEGLELQKQRIEAQIKEIRSRLSKRLRSAAESSAPVAKKRILSNDARKRIAAAQKKRWAEFRKSKPPAKP